MGDPADKVVGEPPSQEDKRQIAAAQAHWEKVADDAPVQAVARTEEAARQIVVVTSALQGLYYALFALGGIWQRLPGEWLWLFILPALFWIASLGCATLVFVPRARQGTDLNRLDPQRWQQVRDTYVAVERHKLRWLHWAHTCLVLSFVPLLAILLLVVVQPIPPAASPLQVVILTPVPLPTPTP